MGFPRAMTGLTAPVHDGVWGGLLEQSGMRGGTKILSEIRMAGHTDLRPNIHTLLLLTGSGRLLPTHETPSYPRSYEC